MIGQHFDELLLLLIIHIEIAAAITYTKEVNGLAITMVSQGNLNPCPFLENGFIKIWGDDRTLPTRLKEFNQQLQRRRVFLLTEHSCINKVF
jgi:hypothetical protein